MSTQQPAQANDISSNNALDPARIKADEHRLLAILSVHPEDPGALAGMGWVRSRQHNFPAAISYLEHAKRQRPNDSRLAYALDSARYRLLVQQGDECLKSGDFATAQARYGTALQIRHHAPQALNGLRTATLAASNSHPPSSGVEH
jgi:Flp pilus assembly protein TadD